MRVEQRAGVAVAGADGERRAPCPEVHQARARRLVAAAEPAHKLLPQHLI